MKSLFLLLTMFLIVGCGRCNNGWVQTVTVIQTVPENATQAILDQQNAYRESIGLAPLQPGLYCSLNTVPTTTTQIVGASLTNVATFAYSGAFNVANSLVSGGLPILPTALQPIYQTWVVLKCTGTIVVTDNNYHNFSLTSEDGALLYVDGLTVNNDGLHSVSTKTNTQFLQAGAHYFELDFFQGAGMQALVLEEDGVVMDGSNFYH